MRCKHGRLLRPTAGEATESAQTNSPAKTSKNTARVQPSLTTDLAHKAAEPSFDSPSSGRYIRSIGISIAAHAALAVVLAAVVVMTYEDDPLPTLQSGFKTPSAPLEPQPNDSFEPEEMTEISIDVDVSSTVEVSLETEVPLADAPLVQDDFLDPPTEAVSMTLSESASIGTTAGAAPFAAFSGAFDGPVGSADGRSSGTSGGGAFASRHGADKQAALAHHGGSEESEAAVDLALQWFADVQSPNGMWDVDGYPHECDGPEPCEPGTSAYGHGGDVACTAYALLCLPVPASIIGSRASIKKRSPWAYAGSCNNRAMTVHSARVITSTQSPPWRWQNYLP